MYKRQFQSTLPRGERLACGCFRHLNKFNFNPRSREGSDPCEKEIRAVWSYFNPRSREGSDESFRSSILTLCWISIHAPARGATINVHQRVRFSWYFNPRSREGSDIRIFFRWRCPDISIHAPARGATRILLFDGLLCFQFQSTLPRGERRIRRQQKSICNMHFNPRSREGSDVSSAVLDQSSGHFNPRSREGSDPLAICST